MQPLREQFGRNLLAAMKRYFPHSGDLPRSTADKIGSMGKSTVERLTKGETGLSLDTLGQLAEALEIPPYRLLMTAEEAENLVDLRELKKMLSPADLDTQEKRIQSAGKKNPR